MVKVLFENHHLYYLPNFIPVIEEMRKRGQYEIFASIPHMMDEEEKTTFVSACDKLNINTIIEKSEELRLSKIKDNSFDVVIVGNVGQLNKIIDDREVSVMIYHGIGLKQSYYNDIDSRIDLRSVESESRMLELVSHGHDNLVLTGYTKCDPLVTDNNDLILANLNLDTDLKTILYAPSFYPTSLDKLIPILPKLSCETNLIIKLHNFSWYQDRYKYQSEKMIELADNNKNIFLASHNDYNIIPYYSIADLLISDISSTMFEYLYLNRPIIMAECFELRLKHKIFKQRFIKRMDLKRMEGIDFAMKVNDPEDLISLTYHGLEHPEDLESERLSAQKEYLFKVDGKASSRIVDAIESKLSGAQN
tara:strand:- start:8374 stop:9462 length:1089 start_codon:yes stop_codon:yes gene_type:complete